MPAIPNLSTIKDLAPVQTGEYDLRIIKAQNTTGKKTGRNGILCVIDIVGEDNASNIMHTLWFGNDGKYTKDDDDKSDKMWRMVKDFLGAIGLNRDGEVELDEFTDLSFTAEVIYNDGTDEDGNPEYPPKNELGKILG